MEKTPENYAIISIPNNVTSDPPHDGSQSQPNLTKHRSSKKRKNSPMQVLKAMLFMMQGRSRKSSVLPVDNGSKHIWRKLVGNIRPLHLQSNQSPRALSQPSNHSLQDNGVDDDVVTSASDFPAEEEHFSPSPSSSRYASADGLNELVQSDEDNEKVHETMEEKDDGDEMIDEKAEEFIAKFYQQMRLQRLDSMDRRYYERNQRSLGL